MASHHMVYCHGWSSGPTVWQYIAAAEAVYPTLCDVTATDQFVPAVHACMPDAPHYVVGWSLGGMLALDYAATQPEQLKGLVLIGTTPKFTHRDKTIGWPAPIVRQMIARLSTEPDKTLREFQMAMFSAGERAAFKSYRTAFSDSTSRDFKSPALAAGLSYLAEADLRGKLDAINCPTLWVHGSEDTICPPACLEGVPTTHRVAVLDGAGHVPHWSRPDAVKTLIEEFVAGG